MAVVRRNSVRRSPQIKAENLFLRRELALYVERGIKPRRIDSVTRISLAILSRLFNWRDALVVVRPETMIRWHRAGWKLFWRPKVPAWPTADSPTITGSDPPHGAREPFVGRGTHRQ